MQNGTDITTEYYKLLNVDPTVFSDLEISCGLSVRSYNALMRAGIKTVEQLMELSPESLIQLKNLGIKSFNEIEKYLESIVTGDYEVRTSHENKPLTYVSLKANIENDDFSFLEELSDISLDSERRTVILNYKESESILGRELIRQIVSSPEIGIHLIYSLSGLVNIHRLTQPLKESVEGIPYSRRLEKAGSYIEAYFSANNLNEANRKGWMNDNVTLEKCIMSSARNFDSVEDGVRFAKWCNFDIKEDFKTFSLNIKENQLKVVQERSSGKSLEEVGTVFSVTRERIRQIEAKAIKLFERWNFKYHLLEKFSAEHNGLKVIPSRMIEDSLDELGCIVGYLLKKSENVSYSYSKELDLFVIDGDVNEIQSSIEELPPIIGEEEAVEFINNRCSSFINQSVITNLLERTHIHKNELYFLKNIKKSDAYSYILKEYYPNGLHVYSGEDIAHFIELSQALFGVDAINSRAVGSVIQRIGVLCGRGSYRLREGSYLSDGLERKIKDYIEESPQPVLIVDDIFNVFKDSLLEAGIDNKYYLFGILQQLFEGKYRVHRNFIFKDSEAISIYDEVSRIVKESNHPISNGEIKKSIAGIKDVYIGWAISADENILNLFGSYFHASRLDLSNSEIEYLHQMLEKGLSDNEVHHIKEFYEICVQNNPHMLTRNFIMYPFSFYSLLAYLFAEEYQFLRPNIANNGVTINNQKAIIHDAIYEYEVLSVEEIRSIASDCHYTIYSMTEMMNDYNDKYLIADNDTLMSIELTGITEQIAMDIESLIADEITQTTLIRELRSSIVFPNIQIPWNEWLIYSAINKWGKKLTVGVTSKYFKQALPVVAPNGMLNIEDIEIGNESMDQTDYDLDDLLAEEAAEELNIEL